MHERTLRRALSTAKASMRDDLPDRYTQSEWGEEFRQQVRAHLKPGVHILDVGGGRTPAISPPDRPDGTVYVGLDLSAEELALAPAGSYDRWVASDVSTFQDDLTGSFDLIVSFQVLEHVHSLEAALDNMRRYLRPGGHLVAQFSGTWSVFGLGNRLLPQWAIQKLINRLLREEAYKTFPAYYDRCWPRGMRGPLSSWGQADVRPLYLGKGYFEFSRAVRAAYLGWEELALTRDWANVAPYYLVDAQY